MEALIEELKRRIKGKRVLILGFGREGKTTFRRVLEAGGAAELAIADLRELLEEERRGIQDEARRIQAASSETALPSLPEIVFWTGKNYQSRIAEYDLVFRSPGIVLEQEPEHYGTTITSQAELFLQVYRKQVIGITGTKGKSTTTTLLYHVLKENGIPTVLMGNIGIPAFDCLEELTPETVVVFEFSCHQLEYNSCSPHRAVYLNLFEEHLDHYGTVERYQAAKENIYRHQEPGDVLYCGVQVLPEQDSCAGTVKTAYPYGERPEEAEAAIWLTDQLIHYQEETCPVPADRTHLLGHHNLYDIAIVYAVARDLGVIQEGFLAALPSYQPLPPRLEFVGTVEGIRFYDDSISTIGETAIQALDTLSDAETILLGGMDRGIDYEDLIRYLAAVRPVKNIILMEATGKRIAEEIRQKEPDLADSGRIRLVEHLEEAVELAFKLTKPGEACVLSPAAASYGIFRDFEERGRRFQELVRGREKR